MQAIKTGLALGGGSARGLAHFGVLKALKEHQIEIDVIAGTSIGAVVGAAFAAGSHRRLEMAYRGLDKRRVLRLMDLVFPRSGLIEGEKVTQFVMDNLRTDAFETLQIEFAAVATDLLTGEEVVLKTGSLSQALRASISVPGVLTPVKIAERILADGAMVNPVPVSVTRAMGAERVIAVDLNHGLRQGATWKNGERKKSNARTTPEWLARLGQPLQKLDYAAINSFRRWLQEEPLPGLMEVLMASIDIMEMQITNTRMALEPAQLLIRPNLADIRFLDFHRADEIIAEGYRATQAALETQWHHAE